MGRKNVPGQIGGPTSILSPFGDARRQSAQQLGRFLSAPVLFWPPICPAKSAGADQLGYLPRPFNLLLQSDKVRGGFQFARVRESFWFTIFKSLQLLDLAL